MEPWSPHSSLRLAALLATLCMALGACGVTQHIVVDDLVLPAMAVKPLPIKMGLYYPAEMRTASNRLTSGDDTYEFVIGPGTIAGFNIAAAAMFEEVVPMQHLPSPDASSGGLTGFVEVSAARGTNAPMIEVT